MAKEKSNQKYLTKAITCPDGSRKYIRAKTRAELERKVNKFRVELGMGIHVNDNTRVAEWAQTWVDVYKRPQLEDKSISNILTQLNCHILPVIGAMRLRDVRSTDCAAVMARMSGAKKSTANLVRTVMRAMFECAVENRLIASNPVTRRVAATGAPPKERVPLTREQLEQVCAVAHTRDPNLYTFVLLCGYAGLRAGEALGLSLESVDLKTGLIHVHEQYRREVGGTTEKLKAPTSDRYVPMPPVLLAHMTALKHERTGYVFDVTSSGLYKSMEEKLQRLCAVSADGSPRTHLRTALPYVDFYVHPHLLRHTYATMCFESGLDVKEVQYLLGHSTSQMTMEVYVHYVSGARLSETAQKIEQAFPAPKLAVIG
jgi:integrase